MGLKIIATEIMHFEVEWVYDFLNASGFSFELTTTSFATQNGVFIFGM
ncbi:MAG: hypothetical protein V5788_03325 [Shewanella sp.]